MSRRSPVTRQLTLAICGAVAAAVLLAGLVALGLIRHSYDGQARSTLHREAGLVAELASRAANTRPTNPVSRVLSNTGIELVRVRANGRRLGTFAIDQADLTAAQAGQTLSTSRLIGGHRYLVEVAPVASDGGVVLAQRSSVAAAVTRTVLRRFLGALAIGLLCAGLFGALLARRISRPLVDAASAAHRLAAGERDIRLRPDGPAEVADVAESLNSLAAALATSEGRQRQFLLSISHELRTPLTAIRGFAEAVADGVAVDGDAVAAGETIVAESNRLQRLVSDLLDLARLGADDFRLDLAEVDLTSLVADAAAVWSARCLSLGVLFSAELPPAPVFVRTDPTRIRQVVDGLAENALRVTPSGAPIVLSLGLSSEATDAGSPAAAVISVRDGGPGLTEADLPVAFDRSVLYERYRGVRQVGTGVGLALVGALVGRLGGTVNAGHAPEGGAAFTVRLPY
ncbi:HAMP domain-containing sensor histidine kinase [Acidothermaceae bacterium B102]|nr:HAMP domain-containing sensor histidine kinase [Acidothermaceae bacterium B102]